MSQVRERAPGLGTSTVTAVAIGGALGSLGRHGVDLVAPHDPAQFPWGTLLVNLSGCLCMGLLVAWLVLRPGAHPLLRPFLGVGVLGGWTTFSALAVQSVELIGGGRTSTALLYLVATFTLGTAAILAGTLAGERLFARVDGFPGDEGMP